MSLLMFDRKAAIIEMEDDAEGATLVLDPSVVSFMFHAFERAWSRGMVFDGKYRQLDIENISKDVRQTIISLMIEGIEDKVIARRLGMSLRTCQRHISEIMQQLGAKNRLHAGYLINALGLHRTGSSFASLIPEHRELSSPPYFDRPERPDGSTMFQNT